MAACKSVLILTDSRGNGLEPLLQKQFRHKFEVDIHVTVYKGATLEQIKKKIDRLRRSFDLIIVIAGICNFTSRVNKNSLNLLSYSQGEGENIVQSVITVIKELFEQNCMVSTITPVSFVNYSTTRNPVGTTIPVKCATETLQGHSTGKYTDKELEPGEWTSGIELGEESL
jgi:hypothetical protein